ncbi:MAG: ABC transporter permease [Ilumatobacter sp.]|uniref:ABC transporter permease n=1 Tax=Ilumatobacter sp. TaxID=1967498 RepID=UPI002634E9C8|nr:ABC transporter permease [Ilumatobacter sp.]MDJ0769969.1 ABC transporter permease [Ilumatobacter sp.]
MTTALAVAKLQLRILRNDPWFLLIMFAMPLAVMPLFERTMGLSLIDSGFGSATGAEQVVPGQAVLFAFFVAGSAGFSVYREHGWRTWDRLRASAAGPRSLLAGFAMPWILINVCYQLAVFVAGGAMLGLGFDGGSPVAALLVITGYAGCVVALVLLMASSFRTVQQMSAFQNVGAMVLAGLGGALVPIEQLPGWARAIAPATPAYWAMEGHRSVFLESGGIADVALPVLVLFGAAAAIGAIASMRFRADETKEFFA